MKKILWILPAFALTMACGGEGEQATATEAETTAVEETTQEEVPAVVELSIESNDEMKYNTNRFDVKEGQMVKLTLKNVGQLPKESMGHNWVLLASGTNVEGFAVAAIAARETDHIPAEWSDAVIAHTNLLGPGEEHTIEFEAPSKGIYDFICTFPGHSGMMKGKFVVQ